jgi:clan AA aspartic protease
MDITESQVKKAKVTAMVDSGAYMLAINEVIQGQLQFEVLRQAPAILADGSVITLPILGPVQVNFENRSTVVEAFVLPGDSEILLGAIPMEGMDVLIDPLRQKLLVNPAHPMRAQYSLK